MNVVFLGATIVLLVVAILMVRELRAGRTRPIRLPAPGPFAPDDVPDITKVGRAFQRAPTGGQPPTPLEAGVDVEEDLPSTELQEPVTAYEGDSAVGINEVTGPVELILVTAAGKTDQGLRRRRNEECYAELPAHALYVVADGMGGYVGGDVASRLAIETMSKVFDSGRFSGEPNPSRPRRGNELVWCIEAANLAIYEVAAANQQYHGMGTTVLAARFSNKKQRVFICHVGDSRCYRFRDGSLKCLTSDHTLAAVGVTGPYAEHLSRVVGIGPKVTVDLIVDAPRHDDFYLLCTDGLSKMVSNDALLRAIAEHREPEDAVRTLIAKANEAGGRDNITVIAIAVKEPGRSPRATT